MQGNLLKADSKLNSIDSVEAVTASKLLIRLRYRNTGYKISLNVSEPFSPVVNIGTYIFTGRVRYFTPNPRKQGY